MTRLSVSLVSFPWPWESDGEIPLFLIQNMFELLFVIIKKNVMLIGVLGHLLRKKGTFCIKIKLCLHFLEIGDTSSKIFDGL